MLAFIRLAIPAFVLLSVLYIAVSIWSRHRARQRLIREWQEQGCPGRRQDYVARGLDAYEHSFRRRLILLIYVVPVVFVIGMIYLMNYS